ncbi:MAG: hypothetical protein M1836_003348 [Candelina mexicana]|nr:MAG: hypothetical protein M1836_003348 [Candelina mexicana]
MKSTVIGFHVTLKRDFIEQIILPRIDWQSYEMPPEMICVIKDKIIALVMQDAEAVYLDKWTGKHETLRKFDLNPRLVKANSLT